MENVAVSDQFEHCDLIFQALLLAAVPKLDTRLRDFQTGVAVDLFQKFQ